MVKTVMTSMQLMGDARDRNAGHPLMEMRQDRPIAGSVFQVAEKFRDGEAERGNFIHLAIADDGADAVVFPEQIFIGVEPVISSRGSPAGSPAACPAISQRP